MCQPYFAWKSFSKVSKEMPRVSGTTVLVKKTPKTLITAKMKNIGAIPTAATNGGNAKARIAPDSRSAKTQSPMAKVRIFNGKISANNSQTSGPNRALHHEHERHHQHENHVGLGSTVRQHYRGDADQQVQEGDPCEPAEQHGAAVQFIDQHQSHGYAEDTCQTVERVGYGRCVT